MNVFSKMEGRYFQIEIEIKVIIMNKVFSNISLLGNNPNNCRHYNHTFLTTLAFLDLGTT